MPGETASTPVFKLALDAGFHAVVLKGVSGRLVVDSLDVLCDSDA